MKTELLCPTEAAARIEAGAVMIIAGSEKSLRRLPMGKWIGGTSHYLLATDGEVYDGTDLLCTTFESARNVRIKSLPSADLMHLRDDRFEGGFSLILIPGLSDAHRSFALQGPRIPGIFDSPLMGWISAVRFEDIGKKSPKVLDGSTGHVLDDEALIMHVDLVSGCTPQISVLNVFEPSQDPALSFVFEGTGFSARTALVNGESVDLIDYIRENSLDTKLPLMGEHEGRLTNVSFRAVDQENHLVRFFSPVHAGVEYRLAKPMRDYAARFLDQAASAQSITPDTLCNCNSILNYFYGELEGRNNGFVSGPATFGEIAQVLQNQTMVSLSLQKVEMPAVA